MKIISTAISNIKSARIIVIALSFFPEITCMLLVEKINTVPDPTMIPATLFSASEAVETDRNVRKIRAPAIIVALI